MAPPDDRATTSRPHERAHQRGSQSSPGDAPDEVRYPVEELRESSRNLLGVSPHAVAGALVGERRKSLTLEEAKDAVNEFLKREVG